MTCQQLDQSLALYAYGELSAAERGALEEHLASCERCRRTLAELRGLDGLLAEHRAAEPPPDLLVRCRQQLEDTLDREQTGWRALLRSWFGLPTVRPARAMTAATFVALGFSLGWLLRPRVAAVPAQPATNTAAAGMTGGALGGARISSISQVAPDPETGQLHITLNAEKRVTVEGSLDDPQVRQVLIYTLRSYDNPGIRLDTLTAMGDGGSDPAVHEALLYALVHDSNAGVRLQALHTAAKSKWAPELAQALVEAAEKDSNAGVRGAAIDVLVQHVSAGRDQDLVPALERLAAEDSDRHVRLKSQAALQQLGQPPF
jgi:HEAT repeats/Putative zinc-finger